MNEQRIEISDEAPCWCCAHVYSEHSATGMCREWVETGDGDCPPCSCPGFALDTKNPGTRPSDYTSHTVCLLCGAIADGNIGCWACVERWDWAKGKRWHTELAYQLRRRASGFTSAPGDWRRLVALCKEDGR